MNDLRVIEHIFEIVDRSRRNLLRFELVQELIPFYPRSECRQVSNELVAVLQSADVVLVSGILRELRGAQDIAELDELVVVAGGDDDVSIGNWKNLVRHDVGVCVADALGDLAGDEEIYRLV